MTRLLVSVRDPDEAQVALEAGAELIDVKEPSRGSLGAADGQVVAAVVRQMGGRVPLSAALGELLELPGGSAERVDAGLSFAKLGLAGCADCPDWPQRWAVALAGMPPQTAAVAVAYADWQTARAPEPQRVLTMARDVGCRALLVDTFDKSAGWLLDHINLDRLGDLVTTARRASLLTVLAGSLSLATIPRVLCLGPDYVAVRGAACQPDRRGRVQGDLVGQLVGLLDQAKSYRFSSLA